MAIPTTVNKRQPPLYLASSSPRRAEILRSLGLVFTAAGMDIDERRRDGETAAAMALRLATEKAAAARLTHPEVVLAADTVVVVDAQVLGKPQDQADAMAMLARLSGRSHQVMTGVAVGWEGGERSALSVSEVTFRDISPDEARAYWQSGEPCDKAGGYAIQGRGGMFVEHLTGSYTGVVGLPVFETAALLAMAGIDVLQGVSSHE
jgi:septum formation protein